MNKITKESNKKTQSNIFIIIYSILILISSILFGFGLDIDSSLLIVTGINIFGLTILSLFMALVNINTLYKCITHQRIHYHLPFYIITWMVVLGASFI